MRTSEANIDFVLVQNFITSVRKRGASELSSFSKSLDESSISTPLLTWFFSNRASLPTEEKISKMIGEDSIRSKNVLGHSIFRQKKPSHSQIKNGVYLKSKELIHEVWPDYSNLIKTINPIISFQTEDKQHFESESNPHTFGEIIYNMESNCHVHWSEIIVHEIAHHYLNVLMATNVLDKNIHHKLKQLHYSHQRNSDRPLIGILHGVFAQSCILIFASKMILNPNTKKQDIEGAWKSFDRFSSFFENDLKTIQKNNLLFIPELTHFTSFAQTLVDQVNKIKRAK